MLADIKVAAFRRVDAFVVTVALVAALRRDAALAPGASLCVLVADSSGAPGIEAFGVHDPQSDDQHSIGQIHRCDR